MRRRRGDVVEPGRRAARLRRRLPDGADAEVVGAVAAAGRVGGVELGRRVGGEADDRVRRRRCVRASATGDVVLADVDAVGAAARATSSGRSLIRKSAPWRSAAARKAAAAASRPLVVGVLVAKLDQVGAAAQRRLEQAVELAPGRRPPRRRSRGARRASCSSGVGERGVGCGSGIGRSVDHGAERGVGRRYDQVVNGSRSERLRGRLAPPTVRT